MIVVVRLVGVLPIWLHHCWKLKLHWWKIELRMFCRGLYLMFMSRLYLDRFKLYLFWVTIEHHCIFVQATWWKRKQWHTCQQLFLLFNTWNLHFHYPFHPDMINIELPLTLSTYCDNTWWLEEKQSPTGGKQINPTQTSLNQHSSFIEKFNTDL